MQEMERRAGLLSRLALALAIGALALPVLLVPMPPVLDYPNHYARLWLIAGGAELPPLAGYYAIDWSRASTNIGIDLAAALLGPWMGGGHVARLMLGAAVLLPPLGAALLHRAAFGGGHWWPVGFALLAWHGTLLAGFLNFEIGIGLALAAAAAEPALGRLRPPAWRFLLRSLLAGLLLVVHVFAAAYYAVLLAALAFGGARPPEGVVRAGLRAGLPALLVLALPVLLLMILAPAVPTHHAPFDTTELGHYYTLAMKLAALLSAVVGYDPPRDLGYAAALGMLLLAAALLGRVRVHAGLGLAALGLLALALAMPGGLVATYYVDWRFATMALLTGAAALRPALPGMALPRLALAALLGLGLARTGWITGIWLDRQQDAEAVARALAPVPPGAAVLPATLSGTRRDLLPRGRFIIGGYATWMHLPTLAVPWRQAFVPTLFSAPGRQPLRLLPPWDRLAETEGIPVPLSALFERPDEAAPLPVAPYLRAWRDHFGYILVINADVPEFQDQLGALSGFGLLADAGFARLYAIPRP